MILKPVDNAYASKVTSDRNLKHDIILQKHYKTQYYFEQLWSSAKKNKPCALYNIKQNIVLAFK